MWIIPLICSLKELKNMIHREIQFIYQQTLNEYGRTSKRSASTKTLFLNILLQLYVNINIFFSLKFKKYNFSTISILLSYFVYPLSTIS